MTHHESQQSGRSTQRVPRLGGTVGEGGMGNQENLSLTRSTRLLSDSASLLRLSVKDRASRFELVTPVSVASYAPTSDCPQSRPDRSAVRGVGKEMAA